MNPTQTKIGDRDANERETYTVASISFGSGLFTQAFEVLIHLFVTEGGGLLDDVIGGDGIHQGSQFGTLLEVDVVLGLVPCIDA